MTAVLVIGAVALVAAVVVRLTWRGSPDERQSMRDYHQTLETLRHVADRSGGTAERAKPGVGTGGGGTPYSAAPSSPSTSSGGGPAYRTQRRALHSPRHRSERRARRRSSQQALHGAALPSRAVSELASAPARYRQLSGRGDSSPKGRWPTIITVALVVLLVALLAVGLVSRSSPPRSDNASRSSSTTAAAAGGRSSTPTSAPRSRTTVSTSRPSSRGRKPKAPASTVPPSVQPTTSTAAQAQYAAPSSNYVVQLSASGRCWILASVPSTGAVLWQGTLQPGQTHQIPTTGDLFLRLGAAYAIGVTLDGEPVVLPSGHASPFDVTFQAT
ncbi:MAG: RodZ domain-containing protein [Acidimicrobiales bacterium]